MGAEFALVAACCRWPQGAADAASVRAAADQVDWERVLRIARRQRVQGLVQAALSGAGVQPPQPVAGALRTDAAAIGVSSLRQAAEAVRLQAWMRAAGIRALILKGAAVEVLAYGRLGLKSAWDIDLLVLPADAERALQLLEQDSYRCLAPAGLGPVELRRWIGLGKECLLRSERTGVAVELHWRLVDSPELLCGVSAASPSQAVPLAAGEAVETLESKLLFAYLCVHGALHGWSRLKWLADLGAILSATSDDEVEALYAACERLGAGVCAGQALLLAEELLGVAPPPGLARRLHASARLRRLVRIALGAMTHGGGEAEIGERSAAQTRILLSHFLLGQRRGYLSAELRRKWIGEHDRMHLPLPARWEFLYDWLRVPSWIWRRLMRP